MPSVKITDTRGLEQSTGTGVIVESPGLECVKYGAIQSLNAADDYDSTINLPAGATITDVGVVFLTVCTTANNSGNDQIAVKVGTSAGGTQLIAATDIVERNKSGVAGSIVSVALGNKAETTANAISFADAALLRDAAGAARTIHTRLIVEASTLATPGTARFYVKYVVVPTT